MRTNTRGIVKRIELEYSDVVSLVHILEIARHQLGVIGVNFNASDLSAQLSFEETIDFFASRTCQIEDRGDGLYTVSTKVAGMRFIALTDIEGLDALEDRSGKNDEADWD